MTIADARTALAGDLEGIAANIYPYPPAVVSPPAIILVPDEPYLELVGIGRSETNVRVRIRLTCAVAQLDSQAQLDQLEQLVVAVFEALPDGATVSEASRPATTSVGPSDLLTTDHTVEVVTTITQED